MSAAKLVEYRPPNRRRILAYYFRTSIYILKVDPERKSLETLKQMTGNHKSRQQTLGNVSLIHVLFSKGTILPQTEATPGIPIALSNQIILRSDLARLKLVWKLPALTFPLSVPRPSALISKLQREAMPPLQLLQQDSRVHLAQLKLVVCTIEPCL